MSALEFHVVENFYLPFLLVRDSDEGEDSDRSQERAHDSHEREDRHLFEHGERCSAEERVADFSGEQGEDEALEEVHADFLRGVQVLVVLPADEIVHAVVD